MVILQCLALILTLYFSVALGNPIALVEGGVVVGTTELSINKFLGVPFASSPPVRFSLPQPVKPFGKKITTQWSPACIQQFVYPEATRNFTMAVFNNPPPAESEDCLYLNIYAPYSPAPPGGRAVMFWIYGGALVFGNAGQPAYDGSSFAANQDVIVVSANYRTNVFGFPGSPEIPKTQNNVGFYDQRYALQWVQRNIAHFGGNPKKVTIFGESAGAASVDRLVTTMPKNPPFRAAIMESGTSSVGTGGAVNATTQWEKLVQALSCNNAKSQLACVKTKPATAIKSIIEHEELAFNPVQDDITELIHPEAARLAGKIARVPTLQGNNAQEGRVFEVGVTDIVAFVNTTFAAAPQALREAIIAAYPVGGVLPTGYDAASQIFTELVFQCPCAKVTADSANTNLPTWRYYFNASFPNTQPVPGLDLGVYHSSEIPLVFGTYPLSNTTPQEIALSRYMQTAWAEFAKNPLAGPGWARIVPGSPSENVAILGNAGSKIGGTGASVVDSAELDRRCALFAPIYAAAMTGPTF